MVDRKQKKIIKMKETIKEEKIKVPASVTEPRAVFVFRALKDLITNENISLPSIVVMDVCYYLSAIEHKTIVFETSLDTMNKRLVSYVNLAIKKDVVDTHSPAYEEVKAYVATKI
jgi:hypothetical protein